MRFLNYYPADFSTSRPVKSVNLYNKMNNLTKIKEDKNQLVFSFIEEKPDTTNQNTGQSGGQIGYIEADQFDFSFYNEINELDKQIEGIDY